MTATDLERHPAVGGAPQDAFRSILFGARAFEPADAEPACFRDLNLDQVVASIVAGRDEEYRLTPFFHTPLRDEDAIAYRHEVFRDLENDAVRGAVVAFSETMHRTRSYLTLASKQHYEVERRRWLLDAATLYCDAVSALGAALAELDLGSRGFADLREYVAEYRASRRFASLAEDARRALAALEGVAYTLRIKGARVTVSRSRGEPDYNVEIEQMFARFRERDAESHLVKVPDSGSMDHVEARIAELVARLHPAPFRELEEFCARRADFLDPLLVAFDREIQFYLAYREHVERIAASGLAFCYPVVSTRTKEVAAEAAFDLALAAKLAGRPGSVVPNDFSLAGPERVLVVTGPNQGGKTTFARMLGQLHYLASLGVPVPGESARLFLADRVFTHFEAQEDVATLRGKLEDELVRMSAILEQATADSVVVVNEIFASTTLADAIELGRRTLRRLVALDCLAVCVTFVDELAALGEATVSMVAAVDPADPSRRTFEVVRRPADGRAYAWALAEKYRLSYERLRERLRP